MRKSLLIHDKMCFAALGNNDLTVSRTKKGGGGGFVNTVVRRDPFSAVTISCQHFMHKNSVEINRWNHFWVLNGGANDT